jgi:hypothetical protein
MHLASGIDSFVPLTIPSDAMLLPSQTTVTYPDVADGYL